MSAEFRVRIHSVQRQDRAELLDLMVRSRHLHEPWITPPLNNAAFQNYLARTQRDDHDGLLVRRRTDDAIVGVINLNNIVRGSFLNASLGYYAGAPYSGMGYMREGLELVKEYAFRTLGLHRLEANIQPQNLRSIALVRHCGFRYEGLSPDFLFLAGAWRDHQRWGLCDPRPTLRP